MHGAVSPSSLVFRLVLPSEGVLNHAQALHVSHKVSFWDAMILAACFEVGAEILYSEDVPGLDAVDRLRVVNPFATV